VRSLPPVAVLAIVLLAGCAHVEKSWWEREWRPPDVESLGYRGVVLPGDDEDEVRIRLVEVVRVPRAGSYELRETEMADAYAWDPLAKLAALPVGVAGIALTPILIPVGIVDQMANGPPREMLCRGLLIPVCSLAIGLTAIADFVWFPQPTGSIYTDLFQSRKTAPTGDEHVGHHALASAEYYSLPVAGARLVLSSEAITDFRGFATLDVPEGLDRTAPEQIRVGVHVEDFNDLLEMPILPSGDGSDSLPPLLPGADSNRGR
jgi:hypothetical protein